jgi:hypothetical protein
VVPELLTTSKRTPGGNSDGDLRTLSIPSERKTAYLWGGRRHAIRSDALRVVERYHRRDFGHMDVEVTFDDPKMYTKPFSIKLTKKLLADSDVLENICAEDEKDVAHIGRN